MNIQFCDIPADIIKVYRLKDKVCEDRYVYVEVQKSIYGLPQTRLLAWKLLGECLQQYGYTQRKIAPIQHCWWFCCKVHET